jgi:apolipoprotein N-acyltransferase
MIKNLLKFGFKGFWLDSLMLIQNKNYRVPFVAIIVSFLLLSLSFPPLILGWISIIVLIPWFVSVDVLLTRSGSFKIPLLASFWGAFFHNATMYYWITNVTKVGAPVILGAAVIVLVLFLSCFQAFQAYVFLKQKDSKLLILFPLFWAGLEVLRSRGELAFPWGNIAYTWGGSVELIQISSLIGGYFISAIIISTNLLGYKIWMSPGSQSIKVGKIASLFIVPVGMYAYGSYRLSSAELSKETMDVAVVQPNVAQSLKWTPSYFDSLITITFNTIEKADLKGVDLIVLPETAIPNFRGRSYRQVSYLQKLADSLDAEVLVGILDWKRGGNHNGKTFYNTALRIKPHQNYDKAFSYPKVMLVPFAERIPFDGKIPLVNKVDLGEGDFTPGDGVVVFDNLWSPNICYEIVFPWFVRDQVALNSRLMIEISNDGWFGESTQPGQHLNQVRFRAVENGMPVARSINTGISAIIDQYGRYIQIAPLVGETTLRAQIPLRVGKTFYSIWGEWIEWLIVLVGVLSLGMIYIRPKSLKA